MRRTCWKSVKTTLRSALRKKGVCGCMAVTARRRVVSHGAKARKEQRHSSSRKASFTPCFVVISCEGRPSASPGTAPARPAFDEEQARAVVHIWFRRATPRGNRPCAIVFISARVAGMTVHKWCGRRTEASVVTVQKAHGGRIRFLSCTS
jgi:hypothetical protein